jgi:outer membrane murein-binding lipoprotein Lpp
MKNKRMIIITLAVVFAFSLLSGCASQNAVLTGADQEAILTFSEAKTDNLMAGMNANDYALFSKDFDEAMLTAMSNSKYDAFKIDRDAKLGPYISREVNNVVQQGDFYSVIYNTVFEKDNNVTMRVVFRASEPHQISGLWFNK